MLWPRFNSIKSISIRMVHPCLHLWYLVVDKRLYHFETLSFVLVIHRMLLAIFTDWVKMIRGYSRNVAERWPIYSKHHSDAVNTIGREILSYPPPHLIHSSLSPVYLSPNPNISQLDRKYWVNIEKDNSLSNQVLSVKKIPCSDTVKLTGKKVLGLRGNIAEHKPLVL